MAGKLLSAFVVTLWSGPSSGAAGHSMRTCSGLSGLHSLQMQPCTSLHKSSSGVNVHMHVAE